MFFILSKILNFLLHPLLWIFILMLFALFFKRSKSKRIFLISSILCLFFFGNEPNVNYFTDKWEYEAISVDSAEYYDYGIVLSGMGSYHEPSKSFRFYDESDRIIQAVTLYKMGKINKLILTGGSGRLIDNHHKEAHYIQQYLRDWGIPQKDILVETASRNTYENARNTVERYYNPEKTYLLITSAFHVKRALGCFQKQGLNPDVYPTGPNNDLSSGDFIYYIAPNIQSFEKWDILLKEWVGYVAYDIMGYL